MAMTTAKKTGEGTTEGVVYGGLRLKHIALLNKASPRYEVSLVIWDHTHTCHPTQVDTPTVTPARLAGT